MTFWLNKASTKHNPIKLFGFNLRYTDYLTFQRASNRSCYCSDWLKFQHSFNWRQNKFCLKNPPDFLSPVTNFHPPLRIFIASLVWLLPQIRSAMTYLMRNPNFSKPVTLNVMRAAKTRAAKTGAAKTRAGYLHEVINHCRAIKRGSKIRFFYI